MDCRRALLLAGLAALALTGCLTGCRANATASAPATGSQSGANLPVPSLSIPGTHRSVLGTTVTADIGTLIVNGKVGDVTVVGSDRSGIEVVDQAAYSSTPPHITRTVSGRTLTVGYTCAAQIACGVAFVIAVPRGIAVHADTDTGAIRLTDLAGPVTAKVDVGLIDASGLTAQNVSLNTDVGGIDATFTRPPRAVTAATKTGAVTIRVPVTATYHVIANAVVGHVTVSVPQGSGAARTITVSVDLGAVSVTPS
jgi:hypothetical protein